MGRVNSTAIAFVESPSIVPDQAPYSADAIRFMQLHTRTHDRVEKWFLILGDMYVRAETCSGHHATLHYVEVAHLVNDGVMRPVGDHGVDLTEAGRELCSV